MLFGSALHAVLAEYHFSIVRDEVLSRDDLISGLVKAWQERWGSENVTLKESESESKLLDLLVQLLDLYLAIPVTSKIIAVEKQYWVPLVTSNGAILEKPLLAITDLLVQDNDRLSVVEFKTSSRQYSESEVQCSLQATSYAHAVHSKFDIMPQVEYTVFVKTKSPKIQQLSTPRSETEVHRLGDIVQQIGDAIDSSVFFPIENPMNCSGCSYLNECRRWVGQSKEETFEKLGNIPTGVLSAC